MANNPAGHTSNGSAEPPVLRLTAAAAEHLSLLYEKQGVSKLLRIGVNAKGCSGLAYQMSWADAAGPNDETIRDQGIVLLVDRGASPFLIGSVMDYETNGLSVGFTFTNPNEKGRCGCGSSFTV